MKLASVIGAALLAVLLFGTFRPAEAGTLNGSVGGGVGSISLSTEGTADWGHWGYPGSGSYNHKSGITQQITETQIGTSNPTWATSATTFSWTGGTPTATASTTNNVYEAGIGDGFKITVPADTTQRTLKVYAEVWHCCGQLQATLSDGSAATYTDTSLNDPNGNTVQGVYTLTYAANPPGRR